MPKKLQLCTHSSRRPSRVATEFEFFSAAIKLTNPAGWRSRAGAFEPMDKVVVVHGQAGTWQPREVAERDVR